MRQLITLFVFILYAVNCPAVEERDIPPAIKEDLQKLNSLLVLSEVPPDEKQNLLGVPVREVKPSSSHEERHVEKKRRSQAEPVI